jgi:hypothetical protein
MVVANATAIRLAINLSASVSNDCFDPELAHSPENADTHFNRH